jgi:hypothetical protein
MGLVKVAKKLDINKRKCRIYRKAFLFFDLKLEDPQKNLKTFRVPPLGRDLSIVYIS